jgi:hypothetical protein
MSTKLNLAKRIKKYQSDLKIKLINNKFDPDKRDYYVSNKKIEEAGFVPQITLDYGILELLKLFKYSNIKFKNNY